MVLVQLACTRRGLPLVGEREHLHGAPPARCHALDPVAHLDEVARTNRNAVELDMAPRASGLGGRARLVQARGTEPSIDANGVG